MVIGGIGEPLLRASAIASLNATSTEFDFGAVAR